jgi:DEAD/DEAH box helicase domain-containing protein
MTDAYPANAVSLRSVAEGNFLVIDQERGGRQIIAEVDFSSAPETLYPGAIYMIQAAPYQVESLDWDGRKAYVRPTRADYYTDAVVYTRLKILERFAGLQSAQVKVAHGEVHLVRRFSGYKKIRYYSHENIGYGNINLPDQEMHTTAVWWEIRPGELERALPSRQKALDGFLGAAYAMHHVAALQMMSETSDLGRAVGDGDGRWFATQGSNGRGQMRDVSGDELAPDYQGAFRPAVFLYDNHPGGIGLSEPLYGRQAEVVRGALEMVEHCDCRYGCPSCVGPVLASDEERGYSPRELALTVLGLFASGPVSDWPQA